MTLGGKKLFKGFNYTFEKAAHRRLVAWKRSRQNHDVESHYRPTHRRKANGKIGQLTKFNYVDQGCLQLNEERTVLDEAWTTGVRDLGRFANLGARSAFHHACR